MSGGWGLVDQDWDQAYCDGDFVFASIFPVLWEGGNYYTYARETGCGHYDTAAGHCY
jgi:hypothetical protein